MTTPNKAKSGFLPGHKRGGRKPGSRNIRVGVMQALDSRLGEGVGALTIWQQIVDQAMAGCLVSQRAIVDRITPPLKPQHGPTPFAMRGDTLTERGESVLEAVASGELDATIGKALLDGIASLVRIAELDEVRARLDALEGRHHG